MAAESEPLLPGARATGLERFPIRTREGSSTVSAWRLTVASDEGPGAIVLAGISPGESYYRGEGVFLGWPQERLEAAYVALLPRSERDGFELHQMG